MCFSKVIDASLDKSRLQHESVGPCEHVKGRSSFRPLSNFKYSMVVHVSPTPCVAISHTSDVGALPTSNGLKHLTFTISTASDEAQIVRDASAQYLHVLTGDECLPELLMCSCRHETTSVCYTTIAVAAHPGKSHTG